MSEFLTQEQIDALLNAQVPGGSSDSSSMFGGSDDMFGSDPEPLPVTDAPDYAALTSAFMFWGDSAGTVLSTLLNKTVSVSMMHVSGAEDAALRNATGDNALSLAVPLSGGINGTMYIVVSQKSAATLSDLMMMGDGSADFIDDHRDAIAELFNQVNGSFTTALGDKLGGSVSSGTISVTDFNYSSPPCAWHDADLVLMSARIDGVGESGISFIIPVALAKRLMELFAEGGVSSSSMTGLSAAELNDLSSVSGGFGSDGGFGGFGGGFSSQTTPSINAPRENVEMLLDVEMDVAIELGRTDLSIKRILELAPGSIVELDRLAGEPVDLMVNGKVVAKGEVVVVDESFGIRIVSLVSPEERIKSLR